MELACLRNAAPRAWLVIERKEGDETARYAERLAPHLGNSVIGAASDLDAVLDRVAQAAGTTPDRVLVLHAAAWAPAAPKSALSPAGNDSARAAVEGRAS